MTDIIFRAEIAKIWDVDPKTADNYLKKYLKPAYKQKRKNGEVVKGYLKGDVVEFSKNLKKKRKPGLPLVYITK